VVDFIFDNYCLRFNRGVVHIVAGYNVDITVLCLTEECFILLWLLILWTITVLCWDRGMIHIIVTGGILGY
jgi:ABC-type uncharacterized transport system permease subunit